MKARLLGREISPPSNDVPQKTAVGSQSSNTVMAVVQDSNLLPRTKRQAAVKVLYSVNNFSSCIFLIIIQFYADFKSAF